MPFLTFLLLCLCWGSTFIPLKEGLSDFPPLLFAGMRFVLAAAVFGTVAMLRATARLPQGRALLRLVGAALLSITLNYGLLFWGAQFLPSGIVALVNFGAVVLCLTGLSLFLQLEEPSFSKLFGLVLGVAGLLLLLIPKFGNEPKQLLGIAAIAIGGLGYALGSLLLRPLLKNYDKLGITFLQVAVGGVTLLLAGFVLGNDFGALTALRAPKAALSLVYLVAVGSLLGFWLYNHMLASWELSKLALYNFVSPVIALLLGGLIYKETVTLLEGLASLCLLSGVLFSYIRLSIGSQTVADRTADS